eukprot:4151537-Prymnesium_polylepis.1
MLPMPTSTVACRVRPYVTAQPQQGVAKSAEKERERAPVIFARSNRRAQRDTPRRLVLSRT